jgi:hypothetical protein
MRTSAILLAIACTASTAVAQPTPASIALDEARAALEEPDLVAASAAVDRALSLPTLSPTELATAIRIRALLAYAEDRLGALEESLAGLAMLEPGGEVPPEFPPPLRARYAEIAAEGRALVLRAELVVERGARGRSLRVVPTVEGDVGRLVRSLRVRVGVAGGALTAVDPDEPQAIGAPDRAVEIDYVIDAYGPGGALLAQLGTESAPTEAVVDADPTDDTYLHVALVSVGAAVLAGAVALVVAWLATDGFTAGQSTLVDPPTCSGAPCRASGAALLSF